MKERRAIQNLVNLTGNRQRNVRHVGNHIFEWQKLRNIMKILLAAVNAKYIHSNLAVYSLKAYAQKKLGKNNSQEIEIAEYTINQTFDAILQDIYRKKPDLLGMSCYMWNIEYVGHLLTELPKILPDMKIWLGGPEVSYDAKAVLERFPKVEGVMCGEGEETFAELLRVYHEKKETFCAGEKRDEIFSGILGIAYRNKDGAVIQNAFRPVIDLSAVPFVYQHIEDFENRIIYYESSRGCPFSCSYCLSSIDKCLRFRETELVKKELQFFLDNKVPQVKFVDRTFNCRHDHAMEIWTYIHEHDNGITNFHFEVSADLLNEKEIALISRMRPGLIQLEIGVQSANEVTIREINRTMKIEVLSTIVDKIKKGNNVHQHLDLIAGLPYEGYESFGKSFDRVYAMQPEQLQLGFLKVLKGSVMNEKAQEYGIVYQDRAPYEVLSTKWLTYGEIIRLKQIEEMVEVYYNSGQFCHTMAALEREFTSAFCMYESLAAYYDQINAFALSHSRIGRYEILYDFLTETCKERAEEYVGRLTSDLYLRDNVKNRPAFLGENGVTSDEAAAFYKKEEKERTYLKSYEGYDRRQMRKMTHLERIDGKMILFDYKNRDPLTGNAAVYEVG